MKKALLFTVAAILTALLALNAYAGLTVIEQGSEFDSISASEIFGKKDSDTDTDTTDTVAVSESDTEGTGDVTDGDTQTENTETSPSESDTEAAGSVADGDTQTENTETAPSESVTEDTSEAISDTADEKKNGCGSSVGFGGLSMIVAAIASTAAAKKKLR